MTITLLTPVQARLAGAVLERVRGLWQWMREQLAHLARAVAEAARHMAALAETARTALRRPDRPAWASPYGPAPKKGLR